VSRFFCSELSRRSAETTFGTASVGAVWLLLEYPHGWGAHALRDSALSDGVKKFFGDALAGSGLSDQVEAHLRGQAAARPHTKLLFVRRTARRGRPGLAAFWGSSPERGGDLYHAEVEAYDDLLQLDLTAPGDLLGHPLLLVCTHGKHDRCCARHGRPLYQALDEQAEEGWVWQSSHVGGDRFAGNVVFLPEGIYFGRVGPGEAWTVLDEYLAGRIDLEHYRGRACYGFATQAAERAVREATGLTGLDDLQLAGRDGALVSIRAAGRVYDVEVTAELGGPRYLTCTAEALSHPRHYAARILRESAA